jgi:ATP/maltotriose-dependent transcriptional regulator MalT
LNGDRGQAAAAARKALADGPWHSDDTLRARTELILRRASVDDATEAIDAAHSTADADAADAPIAMVIQAEAAQRRGDTTAAGQSFDRALAAAEADGVPATTATVAIAHAHWLLGQGRVADAAEVGGRVARWADRDFDCALLQVRLYHALGRDDLRLSSLREAESLAGERSIPATLREAGAGVHLH